MSYDLVLFPQAGTTLTREAFFAAFDEADHFTANDGGVAYHNDDTGTYFHLDLNEGGPAEEGKGKSGEGVGPRVWFNMNFCRPRNFGREASAVLPGFIDDLELFARDGDGEPLEGGDLIGEHLESAWAEGNEWACRAVLGMHGTTGLYPMPAKLLYDCWVWSFHRDERATDLYDDGVDVFMPAVMFMDEGGQPRTFAVWPNLIPSVLPKVDYVVVLRDELPEGRKGRRTRHALVPFDELRTALKGYKMKKGGPLPYLLLDYGNAEDAPDAVVRFVHGLPSLENKLKAIEPDKILDADLLPKRKA